MDSHSASPPNPAPDPKDGSSAPPSTNMPDALARQGLSLNPLAVARLEQYCRLLWEWNERLNLTRHTDYDRFVERDVIDSWQLAQLLQPKDRILDVGTGGGVPGVIVAILRPDVHVTLCESVGKKARAVTEIVKGLGMKIPVFAERAEQVLARQKFQAVVVRAVGPLVKMLGWFESSWPAMGQLFAIKGPNWVQERGEARHRGLLQGLQLRVAASYPMPGTESESVILRIWPEDAPSGPGSAARS